MINLHSISSQSNTKSLNRDSSARLGMIMLGVLLIFFGIATAAKGEVVISEDFNTGTPGQWPVDWYVENGVWEHGVPTVGPASCAGGDDNVVDDFCAGTVLDGNNPTTTDSRLISAPIDLPDASELSVDERILLRYWQWFSYYGGDVGQVQLSVWDAGTETWSTWESVGNPAVIVSAVWTPRVLDLSAHAGQRIRLAFYHVVNDSYNSAGWYVDDIELEVKVPVFTGDFETGWEDWFAENGVWEVGTPTTSPLCPVHEDGSPNTRCAGTVLDGSHPTTTDSRLISAPIDLPDASELSVDERILLRYWQWFSYYGGDVGQVQLSVWDAGTETWSTWESVGDPVVNVSSVWTPRELDLSAHAGQRIRLAFYHVVNDSYNSAGWYIDDITLDGRLPGIINHPPILDPIGNKYIDAGDLLAFDVTATDPDGDALALTASNLPAGATFVDNGDGTGQFNWQTTADDEGFYDSILFTVTDSGEPPLSDSEKIAITVGDVNQPPVLTPIGDQPLDAGELFTLTLTATDPDDDALSFKATNLPTDAVFTDNGDSTAVFSYTPDAELTGNFDVTFIVTDDGSPALSDSEEVTLTVGDVNRPPILDPIGNQVIGSGEELSLLITATDPDDDELAFEVSGLPTGASFIDNKDGTAEFLWTPDEELTGNFWMTFKVTDDGEPAESDSESLHISVGHMNRPPVMDPVGNHGITPGEPFHYALHASDPEGDALQFIVAGLPEDAGFVDNEDGSAEFSWNPTEDDVRNYKLLFRVIDEAEPMASDWEEVTFTVGDINRPPMLETIGNRTVELDVQISLLLTCRDPDGDAVSYEASDLPTGADWTDNENGTALFTWVPVMDQVGSHEMTFIVTDAESESDSETIVISVGGANRPPVLNPLGDREVDDGEEVWIPVIAGDPDGDLVDLSVLEIPEDADFVDYGDGTGDFIWTAEFEEDGINLMTFMATDLGLPPESMSDDVTITVRGECELPEEPENLKVKATRKKVTLTWEYEYEADYFIIYRSIDNEELIEIATTTETTYTENLPNDFDRIEYYVSVVNACGESELAGPALVRPKGP